jgi:MoxR-like ATPase
LMMIPSPKDAAVHLRNDIRLATTGLIGREQLAELMVLAAVAQEHLLIIGPPGTGKSAVVRRVAQALGGRYFEYLLGRFTEPSELFGAVDLRKLRDGTVETDVTGMLPEAEVAFLDEVFLGSTAILNTLLGILNERRFRRGHTQLHCPLRICVGAANSLPDDEGLAAFGDRFLLHLFVSPVPDHQLEAMLDGGWLADQTLVQSQAGLTHLDTLCAAVPGVDVLGVRPVLAHAIRRLRQVGLQMSDRRIVKAQRLIAAAAVLGGRMQATEADIWPLLYALPTEAAQQSARESLGDIFAHATSPTLFSAAEAATQQPLSRGPRLAEAAQRCLAVQGDGQRTAIEALLREIDANYSEQTLPAELVEWRPQLAAAMSASTTVM